MAHKKGVPVQSQSRFKQPQQQRSKARVKKILIAARDLVVRNGVLELKMNDIAVLADVPPGSVYQYFPSKIAVISKLFEQCLEHYHQIGSRYLNKVQTPAECAIALRKMIWDVYKTLQLDPIARQVLSSMLSEREIADLYSQDHNFFTDLYVTTLERVGTTIPPKRLYWRCRVINEMWDGTLRLAINLDLSDGKTLIAEAIDIGLRELELIPENH